MLWATEHILSIFALWMNGIAISITQTRKVELDSESFNIHEEIWNAHIKRTISTMTCVLSWKIVSRMFNLFWKCDLIFTAKNNEKTLISSQACKKDEILSNLYRRVNLLLYHQCKTSPFLTNS